MSSGRHRAELARQGSLADRHLPAGRHLPSSSSIGDPVGAGSGGSGCVSVETAESQETPDSEVEDDLDHETGGGGVRFKVDDEAGGDDKMRLHRRDTPHHLKNKRINQQVSFQ